MKKKSNVYAQCHIFKGMVEVSFYDFSKGKVVEYSLTPERLLEILQDRNDYKEDEI